MKYSQYSERSTERTETVPLKVVGDIGSSIGQDQGVILMPLYLSAAFDTKMIFCLEDLPVD